ncbi:H/ACA ribonucleoprotein complex subunit 2-like protein [Biomphalaria glabrata]|uniref:H/ACA ribonucleoprotein complex subunit 2 n=1 Tax=Biomphalaria glabrata TaxID=6526 RepID=A0A2C9JPF8_BIOGL|nr:H/ACA ribonucleoprotein complex subunit 2-like protein [Biomphalaria glabrata]KAI8746479.1 H/ACA ribonucleoprotein complex subunit 2 protein [Biomphalaria glabrata]KAI8763607.1 H/ACA ribonucleoprotein complex subunit 2-like protein [Biomphalaria glabrata]
MGKNRKSEADQTDDNDESVNTTQTKLSWEDKVKYLSPIARPLASKRLTKKLYKVINKAKSQNSLFKGIKEVQKRLRKGDKGIVVLAGDVSPMDIITHIPIMCEERDIPYCYTPSKSELGESYGTKRQACIVLIKDHEAYKDLFTECKTKIAEIPIDY